MKGLSPSFILQCSPMCTYYMWGDEWGVNTRPRGLSPLVPGEVPDCRRDTKNIDTRQNMPPEREQLGGEKPLWLKLASRPPGRELGPWGIIPGTLVPC